jgi:hypothetical protein
MIYMLRFCQRKSSDYDKALQIGQQAIKYARSQVVFSSTQPENTTHNSMQQKHLIKGIVGSKASGWSGCGIRDMISQQSEERFNQGERPILCAYKSVIAVTSKYSLGNCEELATLVLHYILLNAPGVYAETYEIREGDHQFVVLNRDPYSKADDPSTWGNAIICDPWANEAYSANECVGRLKTYHWDQQENLHKTELYNPKKHILMPSLYFNTSILRSELRKSKLW